MIPINTSLGELSIFEIYEYIDGPRLFAARNNIGTIYLVYWFDETDDATGWLYLPISETRLNELRRKKITLNTAFKKPETNYYIVYTGIDQGKDTADPVAPNKIDTEFFPPEGYYVEYVDVVNKKRDEWSFEIIINKIKAEAEAFSQFFGRFRELLEDIMSNRPGKISKKKTLKLYAKGVSHGSIKVRFSSDSHVDAIESLKLVEELIQLNEIELRNKLVEHKINSYQLKDFLSSILRNKLDVEMVPKLASDGEVIKLPSQRIEQCVKYLDEVNYSAIDSIKIPQANDLDKVFEIVKMIDNGIPLIPENIDGITTPRQVKYYTDAAYALGLTTKDKQLTAAGHAINSHSEKENQYKILADRFESTDFGWAWMTWAQVKYMTDLEPNTAADFLIASVPNLSESTAKRRATTLKKWLKKLKPYHRRYSSE